MKLKMRGQRVVENADGEVDGNFWAQAAAEQANHTTAEDGENGVLCSFIQMLDFNVLLQEPKVLCLSILSSSTMTTMTAPVSMMASTAILET